jgi:hypothetical protein
MLLETATLTFHCCECRAELSESEVFEFGGPWSFACEKCVRKYYRNRPSEVAIELQTRRRNAIANLKRNRRDFEKQAAKRGGQ